MQTTAESSKYNRGTGQCSWRMMNSVGMSSFFGSWFVRCSWRWTWINKISYDYFLAFLRTNKKKRVTSLISPFRDSACKKLCFRDQLHTVRNIPCIRIRPICRKQCIAEELQQIHRDNINSYNLNNCSTLPPIKRLDSRAILRIYCMKIALNSLQLCPLRQAARSAVSSDTFCTIFQNAAFGLSDMRGPLWVWCCLWGNFAPAAAAPLGSWDDRLFPRRVDNGKRPGQSLAWGMVRRSIFVRPATLETPLDLEEKKRTMWKQLKNLSRNLDKNALDIISFV